MNCCYHKNICNIKLKFLLMLLTFEEVMFVIQKSFPLLLSFTISMYKELHRDINTFCTLGLVYMCLLLYKELAILFSRLVASCATQKPSTVSFQFTIITHCTIICVKETKYKCHGSLDQNFCLSLFAIIYTEIWNLLM